jgi:hypothetical protein
MTPSLQAPEQDLEGGSDSASVSADPVHTGNRRFETSEDTREGGALPKYKGEMVPWKQERHQPKPLVLRCRSTTVRVE